MKRVDNERQKVLSVAQRWRKAYCMGGQWYKVHHDSEATYQKLMALDRRTATAADVAAIIGNTTWVEPEPCAACDAREWTSVCVVNEPDGLGEIVLCADCLHAALSVAGESP